MQAEIDRLRDAFVDCVKAVFNCPRRGPGRFEYAFASEVQIDPADEGDPLGEWIDDHCQAWVAWALTCERAWATVDKLLASDDIARAYEIATTENKESPAVIWHTRSGYKLTDSFPNYASILFDCVSSGSGMAMDYADRARNYQLAEHRSEQRMTPQSFNFREGHFRSLFGRVNQEWLRDGLLFEVGRMRVHAMTVASTRELAVDGLPKLKSDETKPTKPKEIRDKAMSVARAAIESGRRFSGITEFARAVGCTHTGKTIVAEWDRVKAILSAEPYPQTADVPVGTVADREPTQTLDELVEEQRHGDDDTKPTSKRSRRPRRV